MRYEVIDDVFPIRTNSDSEEAFSNKALWIGPYAYSMDESGNRVLIINPEWKDAKYDIKYVIARNA